MIDPDNGSRAWTSLVKMTDDGPAFDNSPLSWRTDGGGRPTDEWLGASGYYGFLDTEPPSHDLKTHKAVRNPFAGMLINHEAHTLTQTWSIVPLSNEELAAVRQREEEAVNVERDRRMYGGMMFGGHVFQTRPEDQKRVAGAGTLALAAIINGAQPGDYRWHGGETDFAWITESNDIVVMDAQTVFQFGQSAANWESVHIFTARALKSMEVIPGDFTDNSNWPALV